MAYLSWLAAVKRFYALRGGTDPIDDNENWQFLHMRGYSPQQAVQMYITDNH